jgi:hypothetical protein
MIGEPARMLAGLAGLAGLATVFFQRISALLTMRVDILVLCAYVRGVDTSIVLAESDAVCGCLKLLRDAACCGPCLLLPQAEAECVQIDEQLHHFQKHILQARRELDQVNTANRCAAQSAADLHFV